MQVVLVLVLIGALYMWVLNNPWVAEYVQNPEELRSFILSFGILAPIAIIGLQTFQSMISIIPSQLTTVAAGFIFGPVFGLTYSVIGGFIGSALIFLISQKYGKNLALKLFEKKEIVHFNHFFKQKRLAALFLARIVPIFPNDLVSFAAGLTNMKLRNFNIISTLGFLFQMILLTLFGSELAAGKISIPLIIISSLIVILVMTLVFKDVVKRYFIKDLHKVEKAVSKEFTRI